MRVVTKSKIWRVNLLLIVVCFLSFNAHAKYGGGTGEPNDPYLIYTAEQINSIGAEQNDLDKHFKLMTDLDMSGYIGTEFNVIGYYAGWDSTDNQPFTGVFDGNSHSIFHLTVEGESYLGLFGQLESGAEIRNLGLVDVKISGSSDYVGGLVGYNNGGSISNSFSTGAVIGKDFVGGLVGWNSGDVINCYSKSQVIGDVIVGGLVGFNWDGNVINSFWDIDTSGQVTSAGGTGLMTAEMQTADTFIDAGWDFVDETDNGSEDLWWIIEGQDYPMLYSEMTAENDSTVVEITTEEDEEEEDNTTDVTECFAEQFFTGTDVFDLSYKSLMFIPTTDGSFYSPVLSEITQLPTDPAGSEYLVMDDDDFALINLSNLKKVYIFGFSYIRFYVGSNGYITFTRGDTNREDILDIHFITKRISVLFTDLYPARSGTIRWKQLEDRVAVTWEDISEFAPINSNTFQVEMYFDGRIRLAWLNVESQNGIVGLSQGRGFPDDFQEADFSELPISSPGADPADPGVPGGDSGRRNRKK